MRTGRFFPGKLILSGEHSVVYGYPALAASIDLGIQMRLQPAQRPVVDPYVQHIFSIFQQQMGIEKLRNFELDIQSTLPQKSGLGSSAAFAAALFDALFAFYDFPEPDEEKLFQLVWQAENFVHGNSSGLDPAVVVRKELLKFQKVRGNPTYSHEKIGKIFSQRQFVLIHSGVAAESTREMVDFVREKQKSSEKYKKLLSEIGEITDCIIHDLESDCFDSQLLTENQKRLESLGVVGENAKEIIRFLWDLGIDAKIIGAGGRKAGSGYILAAPNSLEALLPSLRKKDISFFVSNLGKKKQ